MRRGAWLAGTLAALFGVAAIASPVWAERSQEGTLVVSLDGGITPLKLPRNHAVPVTVHLAGGIETTDKSPVPRVNWIRLELAWRGILAARGLAVCPRVRLVSTDSRQAMGACGGSVVGHGRLYARVFVPNQAPFGIRAHLLAFNGRTDAGRPAVWVHAYSEDPPVSFVLPFTVRHRAGSFRTVLVSTIRRSVGPWPHVSSFHITIARHFTFRGRPRSYVSASCPVPEHFTAGFLSLARATYTFAGGTQLTTEAVRSCRAR
jgi:hypothetical protein